MDVLVFVGTTLALGVACSIPTVLVGYLLKKKGKTHMPMLWGIGASVGIFFLLRLEFGDASLVTIGLIVALLTPAIYRVDLWDAYKKGHEGAQMEAPPKRKPDSILTALTLIMLVGFVILVIGIGLKFPTVSAVGGILSIIGGLSSTVYGVIHSN